MQDHPKYKMFLQDGIDHIMVEGRNPSGIVIVSSFDSNKTEEENVLALRELYKGFPYTLQLDLLYDHDFGIVVFQAHKNELPKLRKYCEQAVQQFHQLGYVEWNGNEANFVAADGTKTPLPQWDKTITRLEEWVDQIHPGFKVQGTWNREMTYVNMKMHEYGAI